MVVVFVSTIMLATVTMYSAVPGPWLAGKESALGWAYRIFSGAGTMITYGQLFNVKFKPSNTDSKLRARPILHTYETRRISRVYEGVASEEWVEKANLAVDDRANYGITWFDWIYIQWDEEDQEHKVNPNMGERAYLQVYWDKEDFDWLTSQVGAAQRKSFFWPSEDPWEQEGYWLTYGVAKKYEYPNVDIESDVWNPEWFGVA